MNFEAMLSGQADMLVRIAKTQREKAALLICPSCGRTKCDAVWLLRDGYVCEGCAR